MLKAALVGINAFLQNFLVLALGLVLAAVVFYWFSYTTLIDRVSATEVEVSRNQELGKETHETLKELNTMLTDIAIDISFIKGEMSNAGK